MHCPGCGVLLQSPGKFCPECGCAVGAVASAPPTIAKPAISPLLIALVAAWILLVAYLAMAQRPSQNLAILMERAQLRVLVNSPTYGWTHAPNWPMVWVYWIAGVAFIYAGAKQVSAKR